MIIKSARKNGEEDEIKVDETPSAFENKDAIVDDTDSNTEVSSDSENERRKAEEIKLVKQNSEDKKLKQEFIKEKQGKRFLGVFSCFKPKKLRKAGLNG